MWQVYNMKRATPVDYVLEFIHCSGQVTDGLATYPISVSYNGHGRLYLMQSTHTPFESSFTVFNFVLRSSGINLPEGSLAVDVADESIGSPTLTEDFRCNEVWNYAATKFGRTLYGWQGTTVWPDYSWTDYILPSSTRKIIRHNYWSPPSGDQTRWCSFSISNGSSYLRDTVIQIYNIYWRPYPTGSDILLWSF